MGFALSRRDNEMIEVRQVQEFAEFPADVQKAAANFPEMQKRKEP